jgi:hypothetical protein
VRRPPPHSHVRCSRRVHKQTTVRPIGSCPVHHEVNSVPPRPASSRVDKFDRRRFAVILSQCDPRKRSIHSSRMALTLKPRFSPPYFAFCNWDVIDSTILMFADSRSPGDRFERVDVWIVKNAPEARALGRPAARPGRSCARAGRLGEAAPAHRHAKLQAVHHEHGPPVAISSPTAR